MKILIIEDEKDLLKLIIQYLKKDGNNICEKAYNYSTAFDKISIYNYDVIVLDLNLPDGNGIELLKIIKSNKPDAAVIIVSARNSLDDRINGLEIGADDYLTKPFYLSELNARIKAVMRRKKYNGNNTIIFNEITILIDNKEVILNDCVLELTRKEYDLLLYFIENQNRVLSKESIAEHLWGDNIDMSDNFDFIYTHINNLRKKIIAAGGKDYIKTIYSMGYKFTKQ